MGIEQRAAALEQRARATSPQAYIAALLENARAARTDMPSGGASTFRFGPPAPYGTRSKSTTQPPGREEPWYRIELAPGVELHVSAQARQRYASLIERLRDAAK